MRRAKATRKASRERAAPTILRCGDLQAQAEWMATMPPALAERVARVEPEAVEADRAAGPDRAVGVELAAAVEPEAPLACEERAAQAANRATTDVCGRRAPFPPSRQSRVGGTHPGFASLTVTLEDKARTATALIERVAITR